MIFSKSLLADKDIGNKVFLNSVVKTKELLTDVFGLSFAGHEPSIRNIDLNAATMSFTVCFSLGERIINAELCYEDDHKDLVKEVLNICEDVEETLEINNIPDDLDGVIDKVMSVLENKYDLNFTPLDPTEKDENIKDINKDQQTFKTVFTHEDHEATFTATYLFGESKIKIVQAKKHSIFLE